MVRFAPILLALGCLTSPFQGQQSAPPVPTELPPTVHLVPVGPVDVIRVADPPLPKGLNTLQRSAASRERVYDNLIGVDLEIVVNENGRVDSARAVGGPKEFYGQAEQIEMHRAFQPMQFDGAIRRVRTHDYVQLLPPEEMSGKQVPFPEKVDLKRAMVQLQRTSCFGSCPAYTVAVRGDGLITFAGIGSIAIPGKHTGTVSTETFGALLQAFRKADFLSAKDEYHCGWTDMPTQTLVLEVNGQQKTVVDYGGELVGLPEAIKQLESAVDEVAGTSRWVEGNEETLPALRAEHWPFSTDSAENLALYNAAISRKNSVLVGAFLAAHAPVVAPQPDTASPLCTVSATGDLGLVKQMLIAHPVNSFSQGTLAQCLSSAARSGSLAVVNFWIEKGARPKTYNPPEGLSSWQLYNSPLLSAIQSGNPDVLARLLSFTPDLRPTANNDHSLLIAVLRRGNGADDPHSDVSLEMLKLLLAAGADVNASGTEDPGPPIFEAPYIPQALPMLVAAGAEVNARNENGQTPLMAACFNLPALKALLAAGADPMQKDYRGETALDQARRLQCPECVATLQQAMAGRLTQNQTVP